jgi:RNA polymerase sigma-70 factor (ECF subfamily)
VGELPGVEDIFRTHHDFVWRIVRRFGVIEAATDDAVQEVFVVLHRRRNELDHRAPIRALLYGIARRVAKRHRERARTRATLQLVESDPGSARTGAAERVELQQMADALRRALQTLDEDKRMTFVLADIEGMTAPEIAVAMRANLNTVYARLRAARLRIKDELARTGHINAEDHVDAG